MIDSKIRLLRGTFWYASRNRRAYTKNMTAARAIVNIRIVNPRRLSYCTSIGIAAPVIPANMSGSWPVQCPSLSKLMTLSVPMSRRKLAKPRINTNNQSLARSLLGERMFIITPSHFLSTVCPKPARHYWCVNGNIRFSNLSSIDN